MSTMVKLVVSTASLPLVCLSLSMTGCDEPTWEPGPVGALEDDTSTSDLDLWADDDRVTALPLSPEQEAEAQRFEASAAATVHYLNFSDGTTVLTKASDNAPYNRSQICGANPYPKFLGSDSSRRQLVAQLSAMMQPYNIILTTTRPMMAPYSMEMIGPQGNGCSPGPNVGGIAPMDCGNRNKSNISFTFTNNRDTYIVTAQETAHAFGLEHVDVACDVMGKSYSRKGCPSGNWGYPNISGTILGGAICGSNTQNSHQRMLSALGPWPGGPKPDPWTGSGTCTDMDPPFVSIVEPQDGEEVPTSFDVRVNATDDCLGVKRAVIRVPAISGMDEKPGPAPFVWTLGQLPLSDALEIFVDAYDTGGKKTTAKVTVKTTMGGGSGGMGGSPGTGGAGGSPGPDGGAGSGGNDGGSGTGGAGGGGSGGAGTGGSSGGGGAGGIGGTGGGPGAGGSGAGGTGAGGGSSGTGGSGAGSGSGGQGGGGVSPPKGGGCALAGNVGDATAGAAFVGFAALGVAASFVRRRRR